jgi:hypothetical protein
LVNLFYLLRESFNNKNEQKILPPAGQPASGEVVVVGFSENDSAVIVCAESECVFSFFIVLFHFYYHQQQEKVCCSLGRTSGQSVAFIH